MKLLFQKHSLPRWLVFIIDTGTVAITFVFSYLLRFNFAVEIISFSLVFKQMFLATVVYGGFEVVFKSYAGLIRHTTIRDIFNVVITTLSALSTLILFTVIGRYAGWQQLYTVPISILMIHGVTITLCMFVLRVVIKMVYELVSVEHFDQGNVVVFGAGSMGAIMKSVIESDRRNEYNIVAFIDNNRRLQNKSLSGIPVLGPAKVTREMLKKYHVELMIFAIQDIEISEKREIFKFAVNLGLQVLEVPPVNRWLNGQFHLDQLKKAKVEDLLARDPIEINMKLIGDGLQQKTILVTGAAGSIGSEIVRQLTRFRVKKLILVDNAETPMFLLENEIREHFPYAPVRTILADVTDQVRMDRIFFECRPEIIFHAAAYKHVPLMEENPFEAVRVNVGGTMILTRLAQKYRAAKFVMVSTDKAVNPTNVMGASKRMCEMVLRARSMTFQNQTKFVITRFGNVLGSNGSVIPIFKRQIEEGGPVTVTHPEITRYFMTIPEACQLVLQAGFMGMGGEIFVFDMGDPVKIADLARHMITLSGYEPDRDIRIEYTGLRPGEKLYEELLTAQEKLLPTYHEKLKVAQADSLDPKKLIEAIEQLLHSFGFLNEMELIEIIADIVPEYQTNNEKLLQKRNGNGGKQAALVEL